MMPYYYPPHAPCPFPPSVVCPPGLSRVDPCGRLPDSLEEGGLTALDVRAVRRFWSHFCPWGRQMQLKRTKRTPAADGRQPYLKEFCCCGTATLCCELLRGELVFSMIGRHEGWCYGMEPPPLVPFRLTLRGARAPSTASRGTSPNPSQSRSDLLQCRENSTRGQDSQGEFQDVFSAGSDVRDGHDDREVTTAATTTTTATAAAPAKEGSASPSSSQWKVDIAALPFPPVPKAAVAAEEEASESNSKKKGGDDSPTTEETSPPFEAVRAHLVNAFQTKEAHRYLRDLTKTGENKQFAVKIGGMRFEVFLAPDQCDAFDSILRMHKPLVDWLVARNKTVEWMRDRLLEEMDTYALTKDPCLQKLMESRGGIPYERQVYSLLISYGKVPAQSLHIDMAYPLYQGVLLLTPSPPTHVFPVQNVLNMNVKKLEVEDFVDLLCKRSTSPLSRAGRSDLVRAIRNDKHAAFLVEHFGWLYASTDAKMEAHKQATDLMPGQGSPYCGYLGLPGSVIHRGPACDAFRLSLFVAYGQASDEPYNPDVQFTAPALHAFLSDLIFERMKTCEARWTFLRAGMQLLAEDDAGPADFLQYGDDSGPWNLTKVSNGKLLATAQARFLEKLRLHVDSLGGKKRSLGKGGKKSFYDMYIK